MHAFDPAAVYLMDFPEKLQLNVNNRFVINPTKAGKGSLKIAVKGMQSLLLTSTNCTTVRLDPNNRSVPITVLKRSNGHVAVEFKPVISGRPMIMS